MNKYLHIRLKNYEEAENFLKTTDYIHSDHFKEYKGDTFPNLEMPWHLELEYWIDQNGYHDHFLIIKSKPKREYPHVNATDRNCLPGDDEEKMMDFDHYLPGTRIDESWFKYSPYYLNRCSYEFVGFKIPSAVVPQEFNYILNPNHPDFKLIKLTKVASFNFDQRLFK